MENDPNWTINNDLQSVHVGINTRLWLCRKQGTVPICIMLGRKHTLLYLKEKRWPAIPQGQHYYSKRCIPVIFNYPGLYGIAVESTSQPVRAGKARKRGGSSGETV